MTNDIQDWTQQVDVANASIDVTGDVVITGGQNDQVNVGVTQPPVSIGNMAVPSDTGSKSFTTDTVPVGTHAIGVLVQTGETGYVGQFLAVSGHTTKTRYSSSILGSAIDLGGYYIIPVDSIDDTQFDIAMGTPIQGGDLTVSALAILDTASVFVTARAGEPLPVVDLASGPPGIAAPDNGMMLGIVDDNDHLNFAKSGPNGGLVVEGAQGSGANSVQTAPTPPGGLIDIAKTATGTYLLVAGVAGLRIRLRVLSVSVGGSSTLTAGGFMFLQSPSGTSVASAAVLQSAPWSHNFEGYVLLAGDGLYLDVDTLSAGTDVFLTLTYDQY